MSLNFFSNSSGDENILNSNFKLNLEHLPRIKSQENALPHIKANLPRINMKDDSNLFFDIDGESVSIDTVADKIGNLFFGA